MLGNATYEDSNLQRDLEFEEIEKAPENLQRHPVGKLNPMGDQSFKTLFENVPDAMVIIDAETGKFLDANARAVNLFGLDREELIGLGPLDISPPVQPDGRISAEVIQEKIQELLSENPKPFEWVHRHISGRDILCEIRHARLPVSDRKLYCATAIDITERRQAEDETRQYKQILESTKNPVGLVDLSYIYRYANEPYSEALNKSVREIIGHSVPDLFGRDFFETAMRHHYERCFDGENVNYQTWFDFPGWGRRYMDVRYYPFRDINGRITAVVTNVHDITEIKLLEINLKENEERFRAFMENIPASVYLKDDNDVHIYANLGAFKSTGKKPDELIGVTTRDLWPPDIADRLIELDRQVINGDAPRITEEWHSTDRGGTLWRRDIKFPIQLESGKKLLGGIAIDITELKLAEAKIKELMRFDQLLARLSLSFINVSYENVDRVIEVALERIGRFFELDRCSFGRLTPDNKEMQVTHVWNRKKIAATRMSYPLDRYRWLLSPFVTGIPLIWSRSEGLPVGSEDDIRLLEESGMQAFAGIPIIVAGEPFSFLGFSNITQPQVWDKQVTERFPIIASMFSHLITRKKADENLQKAFSEINELKSRLESENIYLRDALEGRQKHDEIIGESDAIKKMLHQAEQVAKEETTVLILGETGTGKELLARVIHKLSARGKHTMVKVNCAALPANLIESELFGREKGAYTGAMSRQSGRFETAEGSTIFLDEIGDLPLELQSKLLRVLQEAQFEKLGSTRTISVDVRVIAATNHDLRKAVQEGRFRRDLYYRLNVFPITVPPLRERREDIPLLTWAFIKRFNKSMGRQISTIKKMNMNRLQTYSWPGNIRELKNIIERSMILSTGTDLQISEIESETTTELANLSLKDVERNHILKVLNTANWRIRGDNGAAEILGLKPTTLEARMKKLGLRRTR